MLRGLYVARAFKRLSDKAFGENRELQSLIRGIGRLDIYMFRLMRRLCSAGGLLSRQGGKCVIK